MLVKDPSEFPIEYATFDQCSVANGAYSTYICEQNHIHSVWRGTTPMGDAAEEASAYTLNGTTLTAVDCTAAEDDQVVNFYDLAKSNTAENVNTITQ